MDDANLGETSPDAFESETEQALDHGQDAPASVSEQRDAIESSLDEIDSEESAAETASDTVLAAGNAEAEWTNTASLNTAEVVEEDAAPAVEALNEIRNQLVEIQEQMRTDSEATREAREETMRQKTIEMRVNYAILAFAGTGFFFALVAYLYDKLTNSANAMPEKPPAPNQSAGSAKRTASDKRATMTVNSESLDKWKASLPTQYQQMIDTLVADWLQLGELEMIGRLAAFAARHPVHLTSYEHVRLLQDLRVIGSPRNQSWIWTATAKLTLVQSLTATLKAKGYPAFYQQLAQAATAQGSLPITVAAQCGQYAIVQAFCQQGAAP